MAKNVDHIQHVKSSVVIEENGVFSPKLPNPSVLADGEIAVNYAEGYETLSIKNSNSGITTFSSDDYYTEKKLGSGFTGENSANTVTKVIEDNELTISSALNDLNQRKLDATAYTPTDLSNYYTKSETSGASQIATALNGKADASDIMQSDWSQTATTENDYIKNKPNITVDQLGDMHIDNVIHITPAAGGLSSVNIDTYELTLQANGNSIDFNSGGGEDELKIYGDEGVFIEGRNNTNVVITTSGVGKAYYNNKEIAVKDDVPTVSGYADSVKYNSTSHTIEFYHGTTAGTKVFEVDASAFIIDGMVENVEIDDVTSGSSTVKCLVVSFNTDAGKQDINIPISEIFDPSIYYTKEEIDDAELTISSALNDLNERKLDASAYTPTDLSDYYTKTETDSALLNKQDASGMTAYTTTAVTDALNAVVTAHTADTTIHVTTADKTNWNGKINASDVVTAITEATSASTYPATTNAIMNVIVDNELVWANAYNTISGAISSHTTNTTIHLTSTEKSQLHAHTNKSALDAITGTVGTMAYENASSYSSATQIATALADKVNVSDVVSVITPSNSGSTNPVSTTAIMTVVADNEEVVSSALNDLNERKLDATAYTPTDLSNYYTKSETSGATQIATALTDKVNVSDVVSAITPSNSGSTTNPVSVKVVAENEMVMASALNDLNENKLDVTAYTPTEGETLHYLTGMTGALGGTNRSASWSGNCEEITELYTGLNVQIKIPTSGHTSGDTLSINGGEKHKIILNGSTPLTTQYPVNAIITLVYDADQSESIYTGSSTAQSVQGVWKVSDYNTNTTYSVVENTYLKYNNLKAENVINRYQLLLTKSENTLLPINTSSSVTAPTKTLTDSSFDPFGNIYFYNATATTNAGVAIASGRTYQQILANFTYSFNTASSFTANRSVYLVAVPQSDGSAVLANPSTTGVSVNGPISQTLPTTDNGLIYIYLGTAYDSYRVALSLTHPVYMYKGGKLISYTGVETLNLVSVTHAELVGLKSSNGLIPGTLYRITDYQCTTTQDDTSAATHNFDVIVTATDVNVLNENAKAIKHDGDTYFSASTLDAWELKYSLENDTDRFQWADDTNGKGVIWWMKDEWNNECWYDFKNIMFKRYKISASTISNLIDLYSISGATNITADTSTTYYCYTFTMIDTSNNMPHDVSVEQDAYYSDEGFCYKTKSNIFKPYYNANYDLDPIPYLMILPNNVFVTDTDICSIEGTYGEFYGFYDNTFGNDCYNNTFGNYFQNNTFGNGCGSNTFGNDCYNNTFGNSCYYNTFGNYCYYNTFGNSCYYNTFGNSCYYNTFGNDCRYNTFGNYCYNNTFGNGCYDNTFGNGCYDNTFGNGCGSNTFGNYFQNNTFGNSCNHINFKKDYIYYCIIENGNQYINITSTQTTSSSSVIRNFTVSQGVNNSTTVKTISHNTVNDTFKTTYQNSSSTVVNI